MSFVHRLCDVIGSHCNMPQVLPSSNQYVALFMGTMDLIIKASANYERIAEELGHALCIISEHVSKYEAELGLFKTESIMSEVLNLYAHIFLFLNNIIEWYLQKRRKRFLDLFNEGLFGHFNKLI